MKVDVLETMGHAIRCVRPNISDQHFEWHRQLTEARAAIAELIEAARGVQPFMPPSSGDPSCEQRAVARFDAAIAKVQP